jgi:diadenosine tetraphosphatase ApaH/serine/threonine PP2A family protein phosphatase
MAILVISDIHANIEALDAVLAAADGRFDRLWFLGDAVGYGPDPNPVVERLLALAPECWLAGNHDWAALGRMDLNEFNPDARAAAVWTNRQLSARVRAHLDTLSPRLDLAGEGVTLAHGSPRHPIWEYVLDAGTADDNFQAFDAPLGLCGHTHVPAVFDQALDGTERRPYALDQRFEPGLGRRLVNPGSVGQPRDGDPRASYLLLEPGTWAFTFHRVAYDLEAVQTKILAAGLPHRLAARLAYGW